MEKICYKKKINRIPIKCLSTYWRCISSYGLYAYIAIYFKIF